MGATTSADPSGEIEQHKSFDEKSDEFVDTVTNQIVTVDNTVTDPIDVHEKVNDPIEAHKKVNDPIEAHKKVTDPTEVKMITDLVSEIVSEVISVIEDKSHIDDVNIKMAEACSNIYAQTCKVIKPITSLHISSSLHILYRLQIPIIVFMFSHWFQSSVKMLANIFNKPPVKSLDVPKLYFGTFAKLDKERNL